MEDQITCPHCGKQHPSAASFCPFTGKVLEPPALTKAKAPAFCFNCGDPIKPDWRICPRCGKPLQASAPSPTPVMQPGAGNPNAQQPAEGRPYVVQRPPAQTTYTGQMHPQARSQQSPRNSGQPKQERKSSRMKVLAFVGIGVVGLVGLLTVCCLATVFLLGLGENNRTAKLVPANDTQVLVSFSPTLLQLPSLVYMDRLEKSLAVFGTVPGAQDLVSTSQNSIFEGLKIDPQKDLLPWVGNEISMAVIDSQAVTGSMSGTQMVRYQSKASVQYYGPSVLLTAATRSKSASDAFLKKLYLNLEDNGARIDSRTYKNVEISEIYDGNGSFQLAVATYKSLLIASPNSRVIDFIIDSSGKQKDSLYQKSGFQDMLKRLPANRMGMVYWDIASYQKNFSSGFSPEKLAFANTQAVAGSFSLEPSGLRFDYLIKLDSRSMPGTEKQLLTKTASRNALMGNLPGDSAVYFSSQNFGMMLEQFLDIYSEGSSDSVNDFYGQFRREYNVDLQTDLLDYMEGEYALAFVPIEKGESSLSGIPFGVVFTVQVTDAKAVEQNLETLLKSMANSSSNQRFDTKKVQGSTILTLRNDYDSGYVPGFIINGSQVSFSTSERLLELLADLPKPTLADNGTIRQSIGSLPSQERMYMVVDVQNTIDLAVNQMSENERRDFRQKYESILENLKSIAMSVGKMDDAGIIHGQLRVNTK